MSRIATLQNANPFNCDDKPMKFDLGGKLQVLGAISNDISQKTFVNLS